MIARIFWTLGIGLAVLAMLLMAGGSQDMGGLIDYRAWLLMALGILAVTVGNFCRTGGHGS